MHRDLHGGPAVWSALSLPMPCGVDNDSAGKGGGGLRSVAQGVALAAVLCHSGPAGTAGNCLLREVGPGVDTMTP